MSASRFQVNTSFLTYTTTSVNNITPQLAAQRTNEIRINNSSPRSSSITDSLQTDSRTFISVLPRSLVPRVSDNKHNTHAHASLYTHTRTLIVEPKQRLEETPIVNNRYVIYTPLSSQKSLGIRLLPRCGYSRRLQYWDMSQAKCAEDQNAAMDHGVRRQGEGLIGKKHLDNQPLHPSSSPFTLYPLPITLHPS